MALFNRAPLLHVTPSVTLRDTVEKLKSREIDLSVEIGD